MKNIIILLTFTGIVASCGPVSTYKLAGELMENTGFCNDFKLKCEDESTDSLRGDIDSNRARINQVEALAFLNTEAIDLLKKYPKYGALIQRIIYQISVLLRKDVILTKEILSLKRQIAVLTFKLENLEEYEEELEEDKKKSNKRCKKNTDKKSKCEEDDE